VSTAVASIVRDGESVVGGFGAGGSAEARLVADMMCLFRAKRVDG